ncbi:tumor necrosis factor alpha-induced protein 8-like protein 1 [Bombina bombina]|uniref:tumor necrosis factor alpha-induced protein 8-like protein 1 n=1 Tax=Bombina bombina TaxID=8345 RepID=UPI00235AD279|nr:tumor necrosis factor alpha-induced protein 8-like protein 1 [Bombina bombina]XP_053559136.1 tumor necrosis factor alpha-induced protein 8-like protein 1 [Bombina bombina]
MDSFSTKTLVMQAQKKVLSKMATKSVVSALLDDSGSSVLDELYRALREHSRSRKEAHKVIKNLIKVVVKVGVLHRNAQFSPDERHLLENLRKKIHALGMTAVSFQQIDFTFDRRFLANLLIDCRDILNQAVNRHLTAKTHNRINHVFGRLADQDFLTALYSPAEPYRTHLQGICTGINRLLEDGTI